jgi:hydrogenase-4 component B
MIILGLAGALLHVINHGLFKALLFLSAGSIIHKTGTRTLLHYGGLWKTMPYTGFFFLVGAVAICGLPPLNGFVSEWLVYLGIFSNMQGDMSIFGMLAAPGLAMTGGLALLCFTKVFGLSFLGAPRVALPVTGDSPTSMLLAMALLFGCCLWIGVAPATLVPFLQKSVEAWTGTAVLHPMRALVSAGHISLAALALLLVVVILTAFSVRKTSGRRISRQPTWGCGYSHAIARVQYTTSSFAQIIADFFGWALQTERKCERPAGILPGNRAACKTHTPDVLLDNLLQPLFVKAGVLVVKIRCLVQNGVIGYYLFYSVLATCLLLILMRF